VSLVLRTVSCSYISTMATHTRNYSDQYVCFDCMLSRRRPYAPGNEPVQCSSCHKPMEHLSYRIRIPRKDRKKWDEFRGWYWAQRGDCAIVPLEAQILLSKR
jgi:hypothetical protein